MAGNSTASKRICRTPCRVVTRPPRRRTAAFRERRGRSPCPEMWPDHLRSAWIAGLARAVEEGFPQVQASLGMGPRGLWPVRRSGVDGRGLRGGRQWQGQHRAGSSKTVEGCVRGEQVDAVQAKAGCSRPTGCRAGERARRGRRGGSSCTPAWAAGGALGIDAARVTPSPGIGGSHATAPSWS